MHYLTKQQNKESESLGIYLNESSKWCSICSCCGSEQEYSRKDHARSSSRGDWKCKKCATYKNKTRPSVEKGFVVSNFEVFARSAISRGLVWELDKSFLFSLWESQEGRCALSGVTLIKNPRTWSIDRIDNDKGYLKSNVQFVLKEINMLRGKLEIERFVELCFLVAQHNEDKVKW